MHTNVYHVLGSIKLILFLLLSYYIYCMRYAINNMDPQGITSCFKAVKWITYILTALIYFMFLSKFFMVGREDKLHNHHYYEKYKFCMLWYYCNCKY